MAGILCFALGLTHSILGEYLIFNSKRNKGSIVPTKGTPELKERHLRIIWATWHLASVFGWCIGVVIISVAISQSNSDSEWARLIIGSVIVTMVLASILVLVGTKGKHPGWIVLLLISILLLFGNT